MTAVAVEDRDAAIAMVHSIHAQPHHAFCCTSFCCVDISPNGVADRQIILINFNRLSIILITPKRGPNTDDASASDVDVAGNIIGIFWIQKVFVSFGSERFSYIFWIQKRFSYLLDRKKVFVSLGSIFWREKIRYARLAVERREMKAHKTNQSPTPRRSSAGWRRRRRRRPTTMAEMADVLGLG